MNAKEVHAAGLTLNKLSTSCSLDECLYTVAGFYLVLEALHGKAPEELAARVAELLPRARQERDAMIAQLKQHNTQGPRKKLK